MTVDDNSSEPKSAENTHNSQTYSVKKPWPLYLIAPLFFFFVVGRILSTIQAYSEALNAGDIGKAIMFLNMLIGIYALVCIVRMNRIGTYTGVGLCFLVIVFYVYTLVYTLLDGTFNSISAVFLLLYIAVPLFCIYFLSTRKHKILMMKADNYRKHINMQKAATKALGNG